MRRAGRPSFAWEIVGLLAFVAVVALIAVLSWPAWEVLAFGAIGIALLALAGRRRVLHRFQSRLTDELQIAPPAGEARRGEEVDVAVTVVDARRLSGVDVGLVCTEYYDEEDRTTSTDSNGHTTTSTSRETREAVAHEAWVTVEPAVGVQSVRLSIPPSTPFSYEGECLSFRWEVEARGRKHRRLDARAAAELRVLP